MKKLLVLFVASIMLIGFSSVNAKTITVDDLYAQVRDLDTQINSLKTDLATLLSNTVKGVMPIITPIIIPIQKVPNNPTPIPTVNPCNPNIERCGKITIIQNTIPDASQSFTFNHNFTGYPSPFSLDDDSTLINPSATPNTVVKNVPPFGNFTITQAPVSAYSVSVSCVDPSGGTTISGNTANISMSVAESITCTFTNTVQTVCTPNTWTQKADFGGTGRMGAVGFSIGNKGYIGTGISGNSPLKDFWEYNQIANTWTQKADFSGIARGYAVGFSIGDKGYIGTGSDENGFIFYKDFWEYDGNSLSATYNTWTQKADFNGTARWGAIGFSLGNKGYTGTGFDGSYKKDFWEYTPGPGLMGGAWMPKANFGGIARYNAVGFSMIDKGYVGTGHDGTHFYKDFWEYTPGVGLMGGAWIPKVDFQGITGTTGKRAKAIGFSINTSPMPTGYIGIGYGFSNTYNDFWEYNSFFNTWSQVEYFGGGIRTSGVGFSIGNKGYIGTGFDGFQKRKDFWEYCPLEQM